MARRDDDGNSPRDFRTTIDPKVVAPRSAQTPQAVPPSGAPPAPLATGKAAARSPAIDRTAIDTPQAAMGTGSSTPGPLFDDFEDEPTAMDGMRQKTTIGNAMAVGTSLPAARLPAVAPAPSEQASSHTPPTHAPPPPSQAAPSLGVSAPGEIELGEGDRVHQYEVIREIGRGGMGRVLLARDTTLGRRVALKFLITESLQFTERFLVEARTTAQVNHENIVIIHEVGQFERAPYMVLEFLEGQALGDVVCPGQSIPARRAVEIMVPVVRALVRAHQFDIVHRDLKPDNIFVTSSGQIKVLDFGIAKLFSDKKDAAPKTPLNPADIGSMRDMGLTREGAIIGTMPYMSPEQWGMGTVDHATDIWAVGIILYEMLAGAHPLEPLTPERLMYHAAKTDEAMPSLGDAVPGLSPELVAVVDRCLRKSKSERYPNAQELLEALEPLLPGRHGRKLGEGESPFPGLAAFQESDANRFFGRGNEVARTVKKVRDHPLVGLVGPSGVGKSSLVRAGLLPALKESGEQWESLTIRPGRDPLASLVSMLQSVTKTTNTDLEGSVAETEALLDRVRDEPGYVGKVLRNRARSRETKILIFVDQFEELYTLVGDAETRKAFAAALAAIADDTSSPLRVILSMRVDFLDRVAESERLLDSLSQGLVFLQAPDIAGLREALTMPVEMVGYDFESPQLVNQMLDALATTPGALPLLQFAAARLWEARDRGQKLLTQAAYDQMGGVAGTLATHANEVVSALTAGQQKLLREIFLRLVTPDGTRAIVDVSELRQIGSDAAEIDRLISTLVQARLLLVQNRNDEDGPAVEIVHESLISKWPKLRMWLEEGQEDSAFLEQLRTTAKQWDRGGRASGILWRGEALEQARLFDRRFKGRLAEREREFLDAVLSLGTRSAKRKRVAVIGVIALLSGLVVAGAIALISIRDAEKKAVDQASIAETEKDRALVAQQKVEDQLEVIQEKERARMKAESEAQEALEGKTQAEKAVADGAEKISMTNEQLAKEVEKSKKLQAKAEAESERAKKAAASAEKAAKDERAAREQLQALIKDKNKELERLKKQKSKIQTTL